MCLINETLRRNKEEYFSFRTLQDTIVREGSRANEQVIEQTREILQQYGFDPDTGVLNENVVLPDEIIHPKISEKERTDIFEQLNNAVKKYNSTTEDIDEQISSATLLDSMERLPENTIILCVDEVGANAQKKYRKNRIDIKRSKKDKRIGKKNIETTVVYIRTKEGIYRFAADNLLKALLYALAYLLRWNMLCNRDLLIFSDGANNIRKIVEKLFSFRQYRLYLDWYHLRKHCYEVFTMALNGGKDNKEINEEIRYHFYKRLFIGNTQAAKRYLDSIDKSKIKNQKKLEEIKDYIGRKEDYIYNYAIKKCLKTVNSSNQGEKSNDLVIANRCKHKCMSWSKNGITGIGNVKLLLLNNEAETWYTTNKISLNPVPYNLAA